MTRPDKDTRNAQILDAAFQMLEERGFSGLSMQAVARAARASNETLYNWYGDKTGLFRQLIAQNTAALRNRLDALPDQPPLDRLAAFGPLLLTMLLGPRAIALNKAAAADDSGTLGPALAAAGRDTVKPWVEEVMARAVACGQLQDAPPDTLAETYLTLLIGDLQIRRVTGAIAPLSEAQIATRAGRAIALLEKIFPPD